MACVITEGHVQMLSTAPRFSHLVRLRLRLRLRLRVGLRVGLRLRLRLRRRVKVIELGSGSGSRLGIANPTLALPLTA